MSDTIVRVAERKWQVSGSPEDLKGYLRSLQRSGQTVPYNLGAVDTSLYSSCRTNRQGMEEVRHKTTGMIFVVVPAGEFMMGPHAVDSAEDQPQRVRREFDEAFLVAKYPWTGREWHRITGEFPSHFPTGEMVNAHHPELGPDSEGREDGVKPIDIRLNLPDADGKLWGDHPVESVSWDRCREVEDWINRIDFARQFNAPFLWKDTTESEKEEHPAVWIKWNSYVYGDDKLGLPAADFRKDGEVTVPRFEALVFPEDVEKLYQAWLWNEKGERCGFQLPSEAMWEYAARAGTTTRYPNGDSDEDLAKIAWFGGDWDDGHKAVGLKEPNNWGLHDNCGNVFEWSRCMWQRSTESSPENGFIAHGEVRPEISYLSNAEITSRVGGWRNDEPPKEKPNSQEEVQELQPGASPLHSEGEGEAITSSEPVRGLRGSAQEDSPGQQPTRGEGESQDSGIRLASDGDRISPLREEENRPSDQVIPTQVSEGLDSVGPRERNQQEVLRECEAHRKGSGQASGQSSHRSGGVAPPRGLLELREQSGQSIGRQESDRSGPLPGLQPGESLDDQVALQTVSRSEETRTEGEDGGVRSDPTLPEPSYEEETTNQSPRGAAHQETVSPSQVGTVTSTTDSEQPGEPSSSDPTGTFSSLSEGAASIVDQDLTSSDTSVQDTAGTSAHERSGEADSSDPTQPGSTNASEHSQSWARPGGRTPAPSSDGSSTVPMPSMPPAPDQPGEADSSDPTTVECDSSGASDSERPRPKEAAGGCQTADTNQENDITRIVTIPTPTSPHGRPGEPGFFNPDDFIISPEMAARLSGRPPVLINPDFYGTVTLDNLGRVVSSDPTAPIPAARSVSIPEGSTSVTSLEGVDSSSETSRDTEPSNLSIGHTSSAAEEGEPQDSETSAGSTVHNPTHPADRPGEDGSSDPTPTGVDQPTAQTSPTSSESSTALSKSQSITSDTRDQSEIQSTSSVGVTGQQSVSPSSPAATDTSGATATQHTQPGQLGEAGSPDPTGERSTSHGEGAGGGGLFGAKEGSGSAATPPSTSTDSDPTGEAGSSDPILSLSPAPGSHTPSTAKSGEEPSLFQRPTEQEHGGTQPGQLGEGDSSDPTTQEEVVGGGCNLTTAVAQVGSGTSQASDSGETASASAGEAGSSDFASGLGGRSTETQSSSTQPSPETSSFSGVRGLLSSARASFTRLTSHFRSQPSSQRTTDTSKETAGTPGQEKSTSSESSSTPASNEIMSDLKLDSDRPGGAGPDDPFGRSGSTETTSKLRSNPCSPGSTSIETTSQRFSQQPPTTSPTTPAESKPSSSEAQGSTCPSPPSLAADIDPVGPEQSAHPLGVPGERGDSDFPSATSSPPISAMRSTGRSSAISPRSVMKSSGAHSATDQTGSASDLTSLGNSSETPKSNTACEEPSTTPQPETRVGGSLQISQTPSLEPERAGEPGSSDPTEVLSDAGPPRDSTEPPAEPSSSETSTTQESAQDPPGEADNSDPTLGRLSTPPTSPSTTFQFSSRNISANSPPVREPSGAVNLASVQSDSEGLSSPVVLTGTESDQPGERGDSDFPISLHTSKRPPSGSPQDSETSLGNYPPCRGESEKEADGTVLESTSATKPDYDSTRARPESEQPGERGDRPLSLEGTGTTTGTVPVSSISAYSEDHTGRPIPTHHNQSEEAGRVTLSDEILDLESPGERGDSDFPPGLSKTTEPPSRTTSTTPWASESSATSQSMSSVGTSTPQSPMTRTSSDEAISVSPVVFPSPATLRALRSEILGLAGELATTTEQGRPGGADPDSEFQGVNWAVRKWAPLLRGLDDNRDIMAALLESESAFLRDGRSSSVGPFLQFAFPIIRQSWRGITASYIVEPRVQHTATQHTARGWHWYGLHTSGRTHGNRHGIYDQGYRAVWRRR